MNEITREILRQVSDFTGEFSGAYNIREDGLCAGRMSTDHIHITSKTEDKPGLDIRVDPGTRGREASAFPPA